VRKRLSGNSNSDIRYVYGQYGELLGEYDASGNRIREYIYRYITVASSDIRSITLIDNEQVGFIFSLAAVIDNNSSIYYIHTDQLESPRLATSHDQTILWRWVSDSFGVNNIDEDVDVSFLHIPHRFSGQYFDQETGLHYNWHRYYDPVLGRYITSDPLGLYNGPNTYGYVHQNPLSYIDPDGRIAINIGVGVLTGLFSGAVNTMANAGNECVSLWDSFSAGFAGGFVGGFVGSFGLPAVGGALAGGITSGMNSHNSGNGGSHTVESVVVGGLVGATAGFLGGSVGSFSNPITAAATTTAADSLGSAYASSQGLGCSCQN